MKEDISNINMKIKRNNELKIMNIKLRTNYTNMNQN